MSRRNVSVHSVSLLRGHHFVRHHQLITVVKHSASPTHVFSRDSRTRVSLAYVFSIGLRISLQNGTGVEVVAC